MISSDDTVLTMPAVAPMARVSYDPNMGMAWYLGLGLDAKAELPAKLEDVRRRARFCHEIDASIVRDFSQTVEYISYDIGQHITKLAEACRSPLFPVSMGTIARVSVALRLWAGCMSAAKTIAFKTRSGVNKTDDRMRLMNNIDNYCTRDAVYRAGVEAAPAFKRLRGQKVYLDGVSSTSAVFRYVYRYPDGRARPMTDGEIRVLPKLQALVEEAQKEGV